MATLRFKGLVSRMQRAREQLVAGIPADQAEAFRAHVKETIEHVERACASHRSTPRQLPTPSYQAYRFFKTLDLDHLPVPDPNHRPAERALKIRHLLEIRARTQAELARIANSTGEAITPASVVPDLSSLGDIKDSRIAALLEQVQATAAQVEEIVRVADGHVARLALPSRQAYEWFKFLSVPENMRLHVSALQTAALTLLEIERRKRDPNGSRQWSLEFYNTASDWRVRRKGTEIHATFSEGFVGADASVIDALVRLAFVARRKRYRQVVRAYAAGDEFAELLQTIELPTADLDANVRGRHYDLREVFDRVNCAHFDGRLAPPRLTWNKTGTFRVMGHYQYASDTVMISISLDRPDIPVWAIEHVMHHELLHRVMGAQVVNGRLYAHTPAFRAAERAFPEYERADAFLNQLSATLRRRI